MEIGKKCEVQPNGRTGEPGHPLAKGMITHEKQSPTDFDLFINGEYLQLHFSFHWNM